MAKTSKATSALPYLERLLEDEFVQEQIRDAAMEHATDRTRWHPRCCLTSGLRPVNEHVDPALFDYAGLRRSVL